MNTAEPAPTDFSEVCQQGTTGYFFPTTSLQCWDACLGSEQGRLQSCRSTDTLRGFPGFNIQLNSISIQYQYSSLTFLMNNEACRCFTCCSVRSPDCLIATDVSSNVHARLTETAARSHSSVQADNKKSTTISTGDHNPTVQNCINLFFMMR